MNPEHRQKLITFLEDAAAEEEQEAKSYAESRCYDASHLCSEQAARLRKWIAELLIDGRDRLNSKTTIRDEAIDKIEP